MNKGFMCVGRYPENTISVATRRRRLTALKAIVTYLERIRDIELKNMDAVHNPAASSWRYEAQIIISVIDDAIIVLNALL
jgi:hypothetical protein